MAETSEKAQADMVTTDNIKDTPDIPNRNQSRTVLLLWWTATLAQRSLWTPTGHNGLSLTTPAWLPCADVTA